MSLMQRIMIAKDILMVHSFITSSKLVFLLLSIILFSSYTY